MADSRISVAKDSISLVRELAVIIFIGVLIFCPSVITRWAAAVNEAAKNQGGEETKVNLGPVEMTFKNTVNQVSELNDVKKQIETLKQQVAGLVGTPNSPQQLARAKEVQQNIENVTSKLDKSIDYAKTTVLNQDKILQDAPGKASGPGQYGIVVSADKQDDLAAYEVQQLKKRGFPEVAIYDRQNFLRSVARFPDKDAADNALSKIQEYRKGAYVINLDKWCPNASSSGKTIASANVLTCP